ILEADPGAELLCGLRPGVDAAGLEQAVRSGTLLERMQRLTVRSGDTIFIRPGTIHALGGASAAVLRGWRPSSRLGRLVNRWIGWERFWRGAGLVGGALVGGILGMTLAWMIFPIFIGLVGGAGLGAKFGEKIWLAGSRVGWDRLWTAFGTANAVLLGGGLAWGASLLGLGHLAHQVAGALSSWVGGPSGSLVLDWAIAGALGGAFGGAIAGTLTDLFARFSGLVD
ncbi:MAG TPA: hypothetical protein VF498_16100, partial [Anaerolineales bacterium]